MRKITLGQSIEAATSAVTKLIKAIDSGKLPPHPAPEGVSAQHLRWTPCNHQPYTVAYLSMLLGNDSRGRAHQIVRLASLLLDLHQDGELSERDLKDIFEGKVNLPTKKLLENLKAVEDQRLTLLATKLFSESASRQFQA